MCIVQWHANFPILSSYGLLFHVRWLVLSISEYDCIGFDLVSIKYHTVYDWFCEISILRKHWYLQDHTLCRYNVGNLAKLVYDLLADYLIKIKGYDRAIKNRQFEDDIHLLAKGIKNLQLWHFKCYPKFQSFYRLTFQA